MSAEAEALAAIMVDWFAERGQLDGYCRPARNEDGTDDLTDVLIDGHYDLTELAAILAGQQGEGIPDGPALVWAEYLHKDWVLNLNQRLHFRVKNDRTQTVKTIGRNRSRTLGRWERARLDITVAYPAGFSADVHNYMPTAKAYVDGLVNIPDTVKGMKKQPSRGILIDDSDEYLNGPYLHSDEARSDRKDHFRLNCVLQPLK